MKILLQKSSEKLLKATFYKPTKFTTKKSNILKPDILLLLIIQK
jgi:hypothetical protein